MKKFRSCDFFRVFKKYFLKNKDKNVVAHSGQVPGLTVPMGMVMNNVGKKPPQTRSSNHRYSRRRNEQEDGPLSQDPMTQPMNSQGFNNSQGFSQPLFSQPYGHSQVGFSQDLQDTSQADSGF